MKRWIKIIIALAIVGVVAVLLVYFLVYNKPHTDYEKAEATCRLTATELYNTFLNNAPLADSLYTGQVIIIEGPLSRQESSDSLVIAVFVFSEGLFGEEGIRCTMLPEFREEMLLTEAGDPIKIKGYCTGYNETDVILEHCSIIQ